MPQDPSIFTLLQQFHTTDMPRDAWTHAAHMRIAAALVWFYGADAGLVAIRDGIKKLNASRGTPDGLYNETVTRAWTSLIDAALSELPLALPLDEAVNKVVDRFVAEAPVLPRYYAGSILESRAAHDSWVAPTVANLPMPVARPYEVRMARADEAGAAADVVHEVYDEYGFTWEADGYHRDLYFLEQEYLERGGAFFIAIDTSNAKLVGTCALLRFDALPSGKQVHVVDDTIRVAGADCSLERLYVREAARRAGIGRVLMQRCLDYAKSCGSKQLEIWSDKRFAEAHRLYQKLGATVVGERICDDPDESPEWGLKIKLVD